MDDRRKDIAETCLRGAETDAMTFPQIVGALTQAGFESYCVDFRRAEAVYFLPDGDNVAMPMRGLAAAVAPALDVASVQSAIGEAQRLAPGYSYEGFCRKVMAAGCAGYMVSFSGRRAVYFGRTGDLHVERFPQ